MVSFSKNRFIEKYLIRLAESFHYRMIMVGVMGFLLFILKTGIVSQIGLGILGWFLLWCGLATYYRIFKRRI